MKQPYFEVDDPRVKRILRKMGRKIRQMLPKDLHFTVFIFSNDPKSMFYLSSLDRDSGLDVIEEWVLKEKAKQAGRMN